MSEKLLTGTVRNLRRYLYSCISVVLFSSNYNTFQGGRGKRHIYFLYSLSVPFGQLAALLGSLKPLAFSVLSFRRSSGAMHLSWAQPAGGSCAFVFHTSCSRNGSWVCFSTFLWEAGRGNQPVLWSKEVCCSLQNRDLGGTSTLGEIGHALSSISPEQEVVGSWRILIQVGAVHTGVREGQLGLC